MKEIFGHYSLSIWIATLLWVVFIVLIYKLNKAPKENFNKKYFIKNNIMDFINNLAVCILLLRSGDKFIHSIYTYLNETYFGEFIYKLDPNSIDVVFIVTIITIPLTMILHKFLRIRFTTEPSKHVGHRPDDRG